MSETKPVVNSRNFASVGQSLQEDMRAGEGGIGSCMGPGVPPVGGGREGGVHRLPWGGTRLASIIKDRGLPLPMGWLNQPVGNERTHV